MPHGRRLCCALLMLSLASCDNEKEPGFPQGTVSGYQPVYAPESSYEIRLEDPRSLHNPRKTYVYGNYLLVSEDGEGIHVFDNHDPAHPAPLRFIRLIGSQNMTMQNGVLYASYMGDIVALQVSDFKALTLQRRMTIATWKDGVPPPGHAYFECPDPAQGVVIRWKETKIDNPRCYADYF